MTSTSDPVLTSDTAEAMAAFDPSQFGLRPYKHGWIKSFAGVGDVAFAPLAWQHAQSPSFDATGGDFHHTNPLGLIVRLQQQTWGFPPEEAVPVNVLATTADTGGAVLIAYDLAKGCNSDGWLGFAIGMGTRSGVLYSHMLGVREEQRGGLDLGWYLKVLQGYLALQSGHHAMTWTFDPMRGANARLNLEKLAARMINLTIDKYGVMQSSLYGNVPTDRFSTWWELHDPAVHLRLTQVLRGQHPHLSVDDLSQIPEATESTIAEYVAQQPDRIKYRIPGDIDALMRQFPDAAIHWRQEMRLVLGQLMTTRGAVDVDQSAADGPIAVGASVRPGQYDVTRFATTVCESGERASFYLLERKKESR